MGRMKSQANYYKARAGHGRMGNLKARNAREQALPQPTKRGSMIVPFGQPGVYSPMEDSPMWSIIDGSGPTGTTLEVLPYSSLLTLDDSSGPEASVALIDTPPRVDGGIRFAFGQLDVTTGGSTPFITIRHVDNGNMLACRTWGGAVQLYERVGGGFVQLNAGTPPANPAIGALVRLYAKDDQVSLSVDGLVSSFTTNVVAPGYAGVLIRTGDRTGPWFQDILGF